MALKQRKLVEIEFKTRGETVEGYLVGAEKVTFQDGGANVVYLVKRSDGSVASFNGTTVLNKLLHRSDVGCFVAVKFDGTDGSTPVKEGYSPKKLWTVGVDEERRIGASVHATDKAAISDDDLPANF